jgi:hypothetical protein
MKEKLNKGKMLPGINLEIDEYKREIDKIETSTKPKNMFATRAIRNKKIVIVLIFILLLFLLLFSKNCATQTKNKQKICVVKPGKHD